MSLRCHQTIVCKSKIVAGVWGVLHPAPQRAGSVNSCRFLTQRRGFGMTVEKCGLAGGGEMIMGTEIEGSAHTS